MKYIKKYENSWIDDPQVGEYYLIKDTYLKYLTDWFNSPYIKIIDINLYSNNKYVGTTTTNKKLLFHEDMFERKLTSKEVEEYELELKTSMYNL